MNKELKTENQVLRTKYNGPILELKNYITLQMVQLYLRECRFLKEIVVLR